MPENLLQSHALPTELRRGCLMMFQAELRTQTGFLTNRRLPPRILVRRPFRVILQKSGLVRYVAVQLRPGPDHSAPSCGPIYHLDTRVAKLSRRSTRNHSSAVLTRANLPMFFAATMHAVSVSRRGCLMMFLAELRTETAQPHESPSPAANTRPAAISTYPAGSCACALCCSPTRTWLGPLGAELRSDLSSRH
jgi:hypothetical protein